VNSQGQVVGASDWSPDVSGQHAFLFTAGQLQDLGTLGGLTSWATAINGNGNVVGFADTLDGQSHGFVWNGSMQDVGTLGGASSAATGINSSGRIVGYSDTGGGNRHAFIRVTILRDLGTLGGSTSAATGVNDRGTVVGESTVPGDTEMHAFVVVNGVMRDLNAMVPPGTPTLECAAAINGSGVIVANTTPCPLGTSFANITTSEQAYVLTPLG
jgi:probable HAF family extracellular repeat protein